MDVLLIHIPKFNNFYNPIGHFVLGNSMPMGFLGIADYLDRQGYSVKVLHLGVEILTDPAFQLSRFVIKHNPKVLAFDLHWHYQAFDVLSRVRKIKKSHPHIPIVLGGITASYYAQELLDKNPEVDFVIRGEGEVPFAKLITQMDGVKKYQTVPNLSFRDEQTIYHNPMTFVADQEFLDSISFHRYDLLRNAEAYFCDFSHVLWSRSLPRRLNKKMFQAAHFLGTGRGCNVECSYCGGGKEALHKSTGRDRVTLRSIESVIDEIKAVAKLGINRLHIPFDPYPESDYYPRLFSKMREENLTFGAVFESFGLPPKAFLKEFAKTFPRTPQNHIYIGVETGDEILRKKNRGYFFTNAELLNCLNTMEKLGVYFFVSYTLGLPGENRRTLEATRLLWQKIRAMYKYLAGQNATLINLDPGSPAETHPDDYNIQLRTRNFEELTEAHHRSCEESLSAWGHFPLHHECPDLLAGLGKTEARATEFELQKFKCRHFCPFIDRMGLFYPLNKVLCSSVGTWFKLHRRIRGFNRNLLQ